MAELKVFDCTEIRKTIALMKPDSQLFEVRIISDSKKVFSGYFTSGEILIRELSRINLLNANVYITLNAINSNCYGRTQRDRFEMQAKNTTSDNDIEGYEWLMIDLDPKRPAGTSATNEQLEIAKKKANQIFAFMGAQGFNEPLVALSGNGVHLLYRVNLANNKENQQLVQRFLKTLDMLFSESGIIEVDTANYNPSRICKLYGTLAQKGSNTKEQPYRMSYLIGKYNQVVPNDKRYIQKVCDLYPHQPEKPRAYNSYNPESFDLDSWLDKYGIRYQKADWSEGTKYILDHCPFDSNHNGKDACIFKSRNGAIGFHCFHNSCSDKTWQDVRVMFEPDAYEKRQQQYERRFYGRFKGPEAHKENDYINKVETEPIFYTASDIFNLKTPDEEFVKTGIKDIDSKLRGLKKGYVSVMSGMRAAGKSSIISGITLDAVQSGRNVGIFSGELAPKNFMRWMNLQAAGKEYVEPTQFEGYYNVKAVHQEKIADWLGEKFWLYNNYYGNDFVQIYNEFEQKIENNKLDLLILDNLMAFNISGLSDTKYDSQSRFVLELQNLAKGKNVHILFVAHPRKSMGFLRLDDISGTADLANAVDNAFIVHRVNNDFKRLSSQMFGWKAEEEIYKSTNVIEIAKDRDGGTMDYFVPLYYEMETKRLKNTFTENKHYDWIERKTSYDNSDFVAIDNYQMNIPFD